LSPAAPEDIPNCEHEFRLAKIAPQLFNQKSLPPMAKPIDDLAAVFFRMLYEACNGNCVIAGGAALAYYLLPEKLYTNNSIDIFVPTLPQAMYEFTCCAVKIHPNCLTRGPTIQCIIDKVIRNLQHVHEISVQSVTTYAALPTQTIDLQHTSYSTAEVRNIHSHAKLRLIQKNNTSNTIRIIAVQGYPTTKHPLYSNNVWGEHVVSTFDLDIERVFLTPTVYATRSNKFNVALTQKSANSISRREAQMTVPPCRHHKYLLKRLQKYKARQFKINSIQFHEENPEAWTAYLIQHIIAHEPELIMALDIVRVPPARGESIPTHRRSPNLKHCLRRLPGE
jgi:hypothetical protein